LFDEYRKKNIIPLSFNEFFSFSTFFPLILAGPFIKSYEFSNQLKKKNSPSQDKIIYSILFISFGLLKKTLANIIHHYLSKRLYSIEHTSNSPVSFSLMLAAFFYFDFSGYSDIAFGYANLLGFRVSRNFNRPYLSTSLTTFWRRWHISLGEWLREYYFLPLLFKCRHMFNSPKTHEKSIRNL
jgi:D-alanyl-lipoteichoic acid acyltransferase DltB (MBOAT superfamily)